MNATMFAVSMLVLTVAADPARAQSSDPQSHHLGAAHDVRSGTGTGIVQKIDRDKGTVTIKHGPLPALDMPGMTMTFPVKDRAQLAGLKPLQKVEFDLSYDGKEFLILEIK